MMGVELNIINVPEPDPVEPTLPKKEPARVKYGRMEHRINSRGNSIDCHSEANSFCRTRTLCDSEGWHPSGCTDHDEEHQPQPGQDCWLIEWINTGDDLEDHYFDGPPVAIKPNAPVLLEYEGDFAVWEYDDE